MSSARRVAFVSTMSGAAWGGSEELWSRTAAAMNDWSRMAFVHDTAAEAPALQRLREQGVVVCSRPARVSVAERARRVLGVTPVWLREFERFAPDVVCLSLGAPYDAVVKRSCQGIVETIERVGVPLVNVVQFAHESAELGAPVQRRGRRLFELGSINAFVAQGNARAVAQQVGLTCVPRVLVVRNPINLGDTSPLPLPAGGTWRLACVARLRTKTKGQDVLLRALADPTWRGRDWSVSFAGSGPDLGRLQQLAKELGIADRVRWLGQVGDLRAMWSEHHALVLPSHHEGTPLAMVEAMLLGRVCICTKVGGCTEWIEDGVSGFLAERPTVDAVDAGLQRAWLGRERESAIAEAARRRAGALIDPDPAGTLTRILEEAAGHRTNPPSATVSSHGEKDPHQARG